MPHGTGYRWITEPRRLVQREHSICGEGRAYEGWNLGGVNLLQVPSKHETDVCFQQGRKAMTGLMRVPPHHLVRRVLTRRRAVRLRLTIRVAVDFTESVKSQLACIS